MLCVTELKTQIRQHWVECAIACRPIYQYSVATATPTHTARKCVDTTGTVPVPWAGHGTAICLERAADLHMAQLMPLPLTVSCFSKIQIGFTFLVPAHLGSPRQRAVKQVCVCVATCRSLVTRAWNAEIHVLLNRSVRVTTRE